MSMSDTVWRALIGTCDIRLMLELRCIPGTKGSGGQQLCAPAGSRCPLTGTATMLANTTSNAVRKYDLIDAPCRKSRVEVGARLEVRLGTGPDRNPFPIVPVPLPLPLPG